MTINVLFAAGSERFDLYRPHLEQGLADAGIAANLTTDAAPDQVDYIIYAPDSTLRDFTPYTRCKAVLNLWAGVEAIVGNDTLTQPLARMVDHGLTQGMIEWVTGHTLRHHLGMDIHIHGQDGHWRSEIPAPPLAAERSVTILGLGALGAACAKALVGLGFNVSGWSNSPKTIEGVTCYHGAHQLSNALKGAEIVILLLPATPQTENTLNAETLSHLARGAVLINPGRGPLIDDAALLAALDSGQVGHATLDVFRVEPLPADDPYWAHPNVTVVPHKASETRPHTAAQVIVENIRRGQSGLPFLHLVDRTAGY